MSSRTGGLSSGPSCNDPDRWALTSAHHIEWESIIDEDPFDTFQLPFDLCLLLANGNKGLARYYFYRPGNYVHTKT